MYIHRCQYSRLAAQYRLLGWTVVTSQIIHGAALNITLGAICFSWNGSESARSGTAVPCRKLLAGSAAFMVCAIFFLTKAQACSFPVISHPWARSEIWQSVDELLLLIRMLLLASCNKNEGT